MHYNFYFDETFHDRKITVKPSGKINILDSDKNDSYVGMFWGYDSSQRSSVTKQLHRLEAKYIAKFEITDEFKSTTISKKNFVYGIRSFNRDAIEFYRDFFSLLEKISPIIHINSVSKIELLLRTVISMEDVGELPGVRPNSFYYSLAKFIYTYHSPRLIQTLFESCQNGTGELFKEELMDHIEYVISAVNGITRKERESSALMQLHFVLSNLQLDKPIEEKHDFVYRQNFVGLIRLLSERKISPKNVVLYIDKEERTFQAAAEFPFSRVKQSDSKGSVHTRMADHLCGFVGRMMYALSNDSRIKEDTVTDISKLAENDLVRKRLLSPEWFDMKPQHFDLYLLIYRVLIVQQGAYWSTMTWSYSDQISMFYSLLRYMASYDSYENFKKVSPEMHTEYFNSACCDELDRFYSNLV